MLKIIIKKNEKMLLLKKMQNRREDIEECEYKSQKLTF